MAKKSYGRSSYGEEEEVVEEQVVEEREVEAVPTEVVVPPYDPMAPHTYQFLDDNTEVEDPATPGVPVVKMKGDTLELTDKQARAIIDSGVRIVGIETPEPPPP